MPCEGPGSHGVWSCRLAPDIMAAHDTEPRQPRGRSGTRDTVEPSHLRRAGLKVTLPRLKILEILAGSAAAAPERRGHLPAAARVQRGHRPGDGLPRADAVRGRGTGHAPSLRERHGGLRAERGRAPRPHRLHGLRPGRGVRRRRHRGAAARRSPKRLGFDITDHALILYGRCRRDGLPEPPRSRPRACHARRAVARRRARLAAVLRAACEHFPRVLARLRA